MQLNYYTHIDDLPIKIWFDIHKTGNVKQLLIKQVDLTVELFDTLSNAWHKMFDQWMERFGMTDEFMASLRSKMNLARYQADFIITGQKHYLTLIDIEKRKREMDAEPDQKEVYLER